MADAIELWGTFSVADHLEPDSFITGALLYDRLVIPVPQKGYRDKEWLHGWEADNLKRQIDVLGNLAVKVPWGPEQWSDAREHHAPAVARSAVSAAVTEDLRDIQQIDPEVTGYRPTRRILADYANEAVDSALFREVKALATVPDTRIEAVTAYGSPDELRSELGLQKLEQVAGDSPAMTPAAVLDWTIHVPQGETPIDVLRRAAALAQRADFREHRSYFYKRLRDLVRAGVDAETIRRDLYKHLADYEAIMRGQGGQTKARRATQILEVSLDLLGHVAPGPAALLKGALGIHRYYVTEHLERPQMDGLTRTAAMAYDIRREFDSIDYGYWN